MLVVISSSFNHVLVSGCKGTACLWTPQYTNSMKLQPDRGPSLPVFDEREITILWLLQLVCISTKGWCEVEVG